MGMEMKRDEDCNCGDPDCGAILCGCGGNFKITGCAITTDSGPIQVSVAEGVLDTEKTDGLIGEGAAVIFLCCEQCNRLVGFGMKEENGRVYTTDGEIPQSEGEDYNRDL